MLKKLAVLRLQVIVVKPCGVLTQSSLCVQVPIKLLHPVFGRFEHLAETAQPSLASLDFVHTVCAQAKYYYASEEKDYQQVMRNIWKHALSHLGGVSRPGVGRNSTPDLALLVSISYVNVYSFTKRVIRATPCSDVSSCSIMQLNPLQSSCILCMTGRTSFAGTAWVGLSR